MRNTHRMGMMLSLASVAALSLGGCTIDPNTVATDIKSACSVEVSVSDIANVITNDPNVQNAEAIATMICQAFEQQAQSPAAKEKGPAKGSVVHFVVVVPGGKQVPVTGTVQ